MSEPTANFSEPNDAPTWQGPPRAGATGTITLSTEPLRFGDYELLHEIARGGMGVVYRARHMTLNRIVALKMILAGRLATEDDITRFRTEAEAAARLQHPHIVAVHDVGAIDGQHYFSMDFIEGTSLAQKLQTGPMPGRMAARYIRLIARAVHHAHKQGILHRDLKPSNILLDAEDEPHITDFGLAKRLGGDSGQTRTGVVLGTPSYMAPEQAAGKSHELGPACDIYGLGAVLYECITGRPPFRAETPLDTVMQVMDRDPPPPRLLNPNIDHDLETICLKCLEKDPRRRYDTAEALAEDLQRYLNDEPISARSFNVLDRLARTLVRSQHDIAFHTWSTMVLVMAGVIFTTYVIVYLLIRLNQPHWIIMTARLGQFVAIGILFWRNRGSRLLPTSPAERELWTIWIGYLAAYGFSQLAVGSLVTHGLIVQGTDAPQRWEELIHYPFSAVASGMAFFIMGSNYWGKLYAVGLGFWVLAALMPMHLDWAPLEFGALWSGVLVALGLHLRTLSQQAQSEKTTSLLPVPASEKSTDPLQKENNA